MASPFPCVETKQFAWIISFNPCSQGWDQGEVGKKPQNVWRPALSGLCKCRVEPHVTLTASTPFRLCSKSLTHLALVP